MADVTLIPIKFLTGEGSGSLAHAIESIEYGIVNKVDVLSNSWGGGGYSILLKEAIEKARDEGIVFVAAAGNSASNNDSSPHYPSSYKVENVIAVAAYDMFDNMASFSCYGRRSVHVAAPGKDIWSTLPGNKYSALSGTSMATPHISGVVGPLLSYEGRSNFTDLRKRLMYSSVASPAFSRRVMAGGRVDAYNFLMNLKLIDPEPIPYDWNQYELPLPFESTHPYLESTSLTETYTIPGAKYVRVVIDQLDTEFRYDYIVIKDQDGIEIDRVSGTRESFTSDFALGDTVTIEFKSDYSINRWGFLITKLEYTDKAKTPNEK